METFNTVDDVLKMLFRNSKGDWPELSFGVELPNGQGYHCTNYVFQYHNDFGDPNYGPNVREMVILSAEGDVIVTLRPEEKIDSGFLNQIDLENGTQIVFWKREPAF